MKNIRVCVAGSAGKMGQEVVRAVCREPGMELTGAIDIAAGGQDAGCVAGIDRLGVIVSGDIQDVFGQHAHDVVVDFTHADALRLNLPLYFAQNVSLVIGTTGLTSEDIHRIAEKTQETRTGCLLAPNFAIGAVLMMQFARVAARYMDRAEIIEFHHPHKKDAPSGTAIKTAEGIKEERSTVYEDHSSEMVKGSRGGVIGPVNIHSVRLPGFIAHQEVIFGGEGQTLTIRHDSMSRLSFMPGVVLAIRHVAAHQGFFFGLESIIDV